MRETFLNSHNVTFQNCVKTEKDTRDQVIAPCGLSFVSLALHLVYVTEFSYVREF